MAIKERFSVRELNDLYAAGLNPLNKLQVTPHNPGAVILSRDVNPSNFTADQISEIKTFFDATDITGAEAETLTDGSETTLHSHAHNIGASSQLTISGGAVTKTGDHHQILGEGDAADNLDTISGGTAGDLLLLDGPDFGKTITVRALGNIAPKTVVQMNCPRDQLLLKHDGYVWVEVSRSIQPVQKYLQLSAYTNANARTPDSAANSPTGTFCILAYIDPVSWSNTGAIVSKSDTSPASERAWIFEHYSSRLRVYASEANGTSYVELLSSANLSATARWVKFEWDQSAQEATFSISDDDYDAHNSEVVVTQTGTVRPGGSIDDINDSTHQVIIGAYEDDGTASKFNGKIRRVMLFNGTTSHTGIPDMDFNPTRDANVRRPAVNRDYEFTSATGEVWTVSTGDTKDKCYIAGDWTEQVLESDLFERRYA